MSPLWIVSPLNFTVLLFCLSLASCPPFSFVVLGSSLCGSYLDQWLVIHLIGHYITFSHVLFKWFVVSTKPFFHFRESSVHESSAQARVLRHSWRDTVPPPGISWGRFYVSGLHFCGTFWLLWVLLLGVRYQSSGL